MTWTRILRSENVSIGEIRGLKVLMRKAANGAGLLVRSPSSYLPLDQQPQLQGQSLNNSDQSSQQAA